MALYTKYYRLERKMSNSFYRFSVPENLKNYYRVTDTINQSKKPDLKFDTEVVIKRDSKGCLASVEYYTPEKVLSKEIFYSGDSISKINYYRTGKLAVTEAYKNGLLALKFIFQTNGYLSYSLEYDYNRKKQLVSICKKRSGTELLALYKYDDLNRIVCRKLYKNSEHINEQHYKYDILDRIIEYQDDNQHIVVNKISLNNELLSYVIIDRMGNKIVVENLYSSSTYKETNISLNGHSTTIKDTSYVDNIMLKRPYANENDLDLIIANLFNEEKVSPTKREAHSEINAIDVIDSNIQYRTLPISMRKRLLLERAIS